MRPLANQQIALLLDHLGRAAPDAAHYLIGPGIPHDLALSAVSAIIQRLKARLNAGHEVDEILRALDMPPRTIEVEGITDEIERLKAEAEK